MQTPGVGFGVIDDAARDALRATFFGASMRETCAVAAVVRDHRKVAEVGTFGSDHHGLGLQCLHSNIQEICHQSADRG